jgi:glycosyltransferase involved in cell wall biosynthesis
MLRPRVIKVSVIVPVYNPGSNIDDCIRTTLNQSMPSDEYEVIFVDDGSTDETPARLDALAAEHDNVRVEHIPNSGWPGKPRNVGVDMARGEYVYFVDNDDWLGKEALERLYRKATEDDADIVIGKVVGDGKEVPRHLFRRNRDHVTLETAPLLALLTPHKLFRRSFLNEHGIRFPEGRRRLEDHVYVVHAYFHARSISILADYPCYHWVLRDSDENASYQPFDPAEYFGYVREVLDVVEEHTEPGELRDRLLSHWYRGKMLKRVGGAPFTRRRPDYNHRMHEEVRKLALERYGPWVDDHLAFNLRIRSYLLREGTYDDLMALAEYEAALRPEAFVEPKLRRRKAMLRIEGSLSSLREPLRFERRGDRILWVPPKALQGRIPDEVRDATDAVASSRAQILARAKTDKAEFLLPSGFKVDLDAEGRPHLDGKAKLRVSKAAGGGRLRKGDWQLHSVLIFAGFQVPGALRRRETGKMVTLTVTPDGQIYEKATGQKPPRPALRRRIADRAPWLVRLVRRFV